MRITGLAVALALGLGVNMATAAPQISYSLDVKREMKRDWRGIEVYSSNLNRLLKMTRQMGGISMRDRTLDDIGSKYEFRYVPVRAENMTLSEDKLEDAFRTSDGSNVICFGTFESDGSEDHYGIEEGLKYFEASVLSAQGVCDIGVSVVRSRKRSGDKDKSQEIPKMLELWQSLRNEYFGDTSPKANYKQTVRMWEDLGIRSGPQRDLGEADPTFYEDIGLDVSTPSRYRTHDPDLHRQDVIDPSSKN